MSATSSAHDACPQTTSSPLFVHTSESLEYAVTHVFPPDRPPDKNDYTREHDHSLARAVCAAAHAYSTNLCGSSEQAQWRCIAKMLDNLQATVQTEHLDTHFVLSLLRGMQTGGTFAERLLDPC